MNQLRLTIKLVLNDIVESLEEEEDEVVVLGCREQEPGGGEGLQQMQQFIGGHHGKALQVRRHCSNDCDSRHFHEQLDPIKVPIRRFMKS